MTASTEEPPNRGVIKPQTGYESRSIPNLPRVRRASNTTTAHFFGIMTGHQDHSAKEIALRGADRTHRVIDGSDVSFAAPLIPPPDAEGSARMSDLEKLLCVIQIHLFILSKRMLRPQQATGINRGNKVNSN